MIPVLEARRDAIADLCRRFRVKRLEIFGSAARAAGFDAARSDFDFLVTFEPMPPLAYGDAYFGLKDALEDMLGCEIDLVTERSIVNPYFRKSVAASSELLYAA